MIAKGAKIAVRMAPTRVIDQDHREGDRDVDDVADQPGAGAGELDPRARVRRRHRAPARYPVCWACLA